MGLVAAKQEAQVVMDEAMLALESLGAAAEPLREIARYIVERKN
jgi:geranylgeranyl diphosphate synthase type II